MNIKNIEQACENLKDIFQETAEQVIGMENLKPKKANKIFNLIDSRNENKRKYKQLDMKIQRKFTKAKEI